VDHQSHPSHALSHHTVHVCGLLVEYARLPACLPACLRSVTGGGTMDISSSILRNGFLFGQQLEQVPVPVIRAYSTAVLYAYSTAETNTVLLKRIQYC
jgi:hypothetical protein